jgi:hypothetical protein
MMMSALYMYGVEEGPKSCHKLAWSVGSAEQDSNRITVRAVGGWHFKISGVRRHTDMFMGTQTINLNISFAPDFNKF